MESHELKEIVKMLETAFDELEKVKTLLTEIAVKISETAN